MFTVDQKFPEFSLEFYNPVNGETSKMGSADFKGKIYVLFFYPADFTFVCPTELADMARRQEEFKSAGAEVIVVSTDTVFTHKAWVETEGLLKDFKFMMGADHNGKFSRELGIYDEASGVAQRAAFIIDGEGVLRGVDITSDNIGRSAGEILRKVKAIKFVTANKGKACPASWDEGAKTLTPSINLVGKVKEALDS